MQTPSEPTAAPPIRDDQSGDQITVGPISNSSNIAIGKHIQQYILIDGPNAGQHITLPSEPELIAYLSALRQIEEYKRWADLPDPDAPLFEVSNDGRTPDSYIETSARPLPLPTRVSPFRSQSQSQDAPPQDVIETLRQARRAVILGEPGSGKSSALQRWAWVIANEATANNQLSTFNSQLSTTLLSLPIFGRLADYQGEADLIPLLRRAINQVGVLELDDGSTRHLLRAKNLRFVLLLDGLNELDRSLSQQGLRVLRNHLSDYPSHTVHLTCRTADYDLATQTLPNAPVWVVQPLTDQIRYWDDKQGESDIRTYLRRHLGEKAGERLYVRLRSDERLRSLAQLPIFLWMFKETAGATAGELPSDRGGLLRSFVENGLLTRIDKHLLDYAERSLYRLAWQLQNDGRLECSEEELEELLEQVLGPRRSHDLATIRRSLQESGLLIDLGRARLRLLHQLVQEYAAAAHLVSLDDCATRLRTLAQQEAWRETVILALWLRTELHTPDTLLSLMSDSAIDLRVRVEAGRILATIGDPRLHPQTSQLVTYIEPKMIAIPAGNAILGSQDEDAYDNEQPQCTVPIAAFELAVYPVTNAEYNCFIEAGGYDDESLWTPDGQAWLRGEGKLDAATEQNLREEHQYISRDVEAWIARLKRSQSLSDETADTYRWIATLSEDRYVELYQQQIFNEKRRQPYYWTDSRYNLTNQPVVGVNWYEAMTYAAWMSRVTGKHYVLPSEAQWEWSASRREGDKETRSRKYPWGDRWDEARCNWAGSRLNQPSPIGCFPQGSTPDGLQEMAGNVQEWTRSIYKPYPYIADDGREDTLAEGLRVVRGGSWYTDKRTVRCAYRNRDYARNWNNNGGMRLARISL